MGREVKTRFRQAAKSSGLPMPTDEAWSRASHLPPDSLWDAMRALLLWAPESAERGVVALGRISGSGSLLHARGVLATLQKGVAKLAVVSVDNRIEASYGAVPVCVARDLKELLLIASGDCTIEPARSIVPAPPPSVDIDPITKKRLANVFAVGLGERSDLKVLLIGKPDRRRFSAARWLYSQWASPRAGDLMQSAMSFSRAGVLDLANIDVPPFRALHHSMNDYAIFNPNTGEVELARGGVLYLDDLPDYRPETLKLLVSRIKKGDLRNVGIVCSSHRHLNLVVGLNFDAQVRLD